MVGSINQTVAGAGDHVGVQRDPGLVPQPEQQQPSLHARDRRLADQLVQALRVQLPPHLCRYCVDIVCSVDALLFLNIYTNYLH